MTLRENAMAIYNHEQPDRYDDIMNAITLVPDPVLMSGFPPQDGLPHADGWGVQRIWKPGARIAAHATLFCQDPRFFAGRAASLLNWNIRTRFGS